MGNLISAISNGSSDGISDIGTTNIPQYHSDPKVIGAVNVGGLLFLIHEMNFSE